jgi:hypothetical protein
MGQSNMLVAKKKKKGTWEALHLINRRRGVVGSIRVPSVYRGTISNRCLTMNGARPKNN